MPSRPDPNGRSGIAIPLSLRLKYALLRPLFGTALYRATLMGATPRLHLRPQERWIEDPELAAVTAGRALAGRLSETEAHRFEWLDSMPEADEQGAATNQEIHAARDSVLQWIDANRRWSLPAWRADILAARLMTWLRHMDWLAGKAGPDERATILESIGLQLRHLRRTAGTEVDGAARIEALMGLLTVQTGLSPERSVPPDTLRYLMAEIDRQVLPDGMHLERSPRLQAKVLRILVELRDLLQDASTEVPQALRNAIDRMCPALRLFRHGDGGLALFNDSLEEFPEAVEQLLRRADAKGKPPERTPHSGFERIVAGRVIAIVDAGAPPPNGLDMHAHAGTLSLELSVGPDRMIVNCGPALERPEWELPLRATAAHSTISIEDTNSSQLVEGTAGVRLGRRPAAVVADRDEQEGSTWIYASQDGYAGRFGLIHRRRLFVSADGTDIRGEDSLDLANPQQGPAHPWQERKFTLRFHLHPNVSASLSQNGKAVLIRFPQGKGGRAKPGWRMMTNAGRLDLIDSIYLGAGGEPRRARQIVITGPVGRSGATVKWALRQTAS